MRNFRADSGYCWLVMVASFVALMLESGSRPCLGVYFLYLIDDFKCSRADAAYVFALVNSVTFLTAPIASALFKTIGARSVVIAGSLIASLGYAISYFANSIGFMMFTSILIGVGCCFIRTSIVSAQPQYFCKYRNFAMSFVMCGPGVGTFIFPPLFYYLIDLYTWRGSMLINAGLLLNVAVAGALLRTRKETDTISTWSHLKELFEPSLWRDPIFTLQGLVLALAAGSGFSYYAMVIALMVQRGITEQSATFMFALNGICALIGRFAGAAFNHVSCTNIPLLYAVSLMLSMIPHPMAAFCSNLPEFVVDNAINGFGFGLFTVTMAPLDVEIFGGDRLPVVMGFGGLLNGLGGLIIPKIAGELADRYALESAFYLAGLSGGLAIVTGWGIFCIAQRRKKTRPRERTMTIEF